MAATKVDVRPPSTFKDKLSGSFSSTSLSMSGLNAISSPELSARQFNNFAASSTPFRRSSFHGANHVVYKAASFSDGDGLDADCGCKGMFMSGEEPVQDNPKAGEGKQRANGTLGLNRGAVFGLFGAFAFHPSLSPLSTQGCGFTNIGLVNLSQFSQFNHPPLLFPVLNSHLHSQPPGDSLLVPTLSQFEVKCSPHSGEKEDNDPLSDSQDSQQQLCQHNMSNPLSENKFDCETCAQPSTNSPLTSKEVSMEAMSGALHDKAVSGDDEIPVAIHNPLNEIHVTLKDVPDIECHCADFNGDDIQKAGRHEPTSPSQLTSSTKLDSHAPKVDHLAIKGHCELRKLLSDESGFYETSSPSEPPPEGLSGWWQARQSWDDDEEEEVDWDEEDCEGPLCEGDESADDLWKSFEDCMLSPQCLMVPPAKLQIPKAPKTPETPQTPLSQASKAPQTPATPQTLTTQALKTQDTHPPLDSPPAEHDHKAECKLVCGSLTTEQWCSGCCEHHSTQIDTSSHCTNRTTAADMAASATTSAVCRSRKRVHFPENSKISVVHEIVVWNFAYRAARKGPWEQYARDRAHFRRRIDNLASILEPCLLSKVASMAI